MIKHYSSLLTTSLTNLLNTTATLQVLLRWYLLLIAVSFIGRSVIFVYFFDRLVDTQANVWLTFLHGLRMDTIMACILLLLPAIILHISPIRLANQSNRLLQAYFFIAIITAIFMENATLPFINEYDVRPNILFINYLEYPDEIFNTIWSVYKLELFIALCMIVITARWFISNSVSCFLPALQTPLSNRLLLLLPIFLLLVLGIRSSLGHRPANPSDAIYSDNRILNEITKNTLHSVAYAAYSKLRHDGDAKKYGSIKTDNAFAQTSSRLNIVYNNNKTPFKRIEKSHFKSSKPKNLVILLEESMGAQFVGALNGSNDVTPNINALSHEGVLFKKLYSTSTRSIRGISGTIAGFLPAPGEGIVKRNLSQNDFFTVANLLKPYQYKTSFFYGGESRFDNMKSWFSGNGFDDIFDEETFSENDFHGTWGVDDVTVVKKANAYYKQLHENNERFVSVIFSTTNHTPFDFPPDVIQLEAGVPEKSVQNAIKYADHAIGEFIRLAKQSGYYDDTIFLIIADHNVRVYGDDLIPVAMFHIPGLILGGSVSPKVIDSLSSQPDALATALDFVGIDFNYPILGHSVFSKNKKDITYLQYHDIYGLRYKNKIAIIQPNLAAQTFTIDDKDRLTLTEHDISLEADVLAFIKTLDVLYHQQLFQ